MVDNSGDTPSKKSHSTLVSSKFPSKESLNLKGRPDITVVTSGILEDACCRPWEGKPMCFQCARSHHVHNKDSIMAIFVNESRELDHALHRRSAVRTLVIGSLVVPAPPSNTDLSSIFVFHFHHASATYRLKRGFL